MPQAFPISNGMRVLGIDYGAKRVGLAVSDETGAFAYPYSVLANDARLIAAVKKICEEEKIGKIILGESKNLSGENNPLMKPLALFKNKLAAATNLPIDWEPEFFTTAAAERLQGKTGSLDASAAALILKSYLERGKINHA